jgi:hypothetical protein
MKILSVLINFFKRTMNMEMYIVTLDTTFANKLGKSLQNYGFCLASDANMARERFLQPLRQRVQPNVLAELFPYVYAYKVSDIVDTLNEQHPLWTYASPLNTREVGQQVKTPYFSNSLQPVEAPVQAEPVVASAPVVVEEFKAPEGLTDPVQIAMLKMIHDLSKEVKSLKNAPAVAAAKVSVQDLEARFRAPTSVGDRAIDPNSVPIPDIASVTSFPKGKIDQKTLDRLRSNISKSRFEEEDEGGNINSGTN